MAKIEWTSEAAAVFSMYIKNARAEFGMSTAKRWQRERKGIEWRLERYPTSYPFEELLRGRKFLYRCCHIMGGRFKFIYFYDSAKDIAYIVDIWDTRMNPKALARRVL